MKVHALWCHPRSVSTAFERIMRERGDLQVLHEPFLHQFYLTGSARLFPDFTPDPNHPRTYAETRGMIAGLAREGPVFFKDMAYYVDGEINQDAPFLASASHAFLIRDPAEAILSYQKRDPDFTLTELGYEAQHRLFQTLKSLGRTPLVLTADQIRLTPEATMARYWRHISMPFAPHAFTWDDTVPEGWGAVVGWHDDVLARGRIEPPKSGRDPMQTLAALGSPYTRYFEHHLPFYEALLREAETQVEGDHQK